MPQLAFGEGMSKESSIYDKNVVIIIIVSVLFWVTIGCAAKYFLDRRKPIQITTQPVQSDVYVNGRLICETSPCQLEALPIWGGYVQISKAGYTDEYIYFDTIDAVSLPYENYDINMQKQYLSFEDKWKLILTDPIAAYEYNLEQSLYTIERQCPDIEIMRSIPEGFERPKTMKQQQITSNVEGALAILDDDYLSSPKDMCIMPCSLNVETSRAYWIIAYKYGYTPEFKSFDTGLLDPTKPMEITFLTNWVDAYKRKAQCNSELEARLNEDRDVEVCKREASRMPPAAKRSGNCRVKFDISTEGFPVNVEAYDCTDAIFKKPTINTVRGWYYYPKVENGVNVERKGVKSKMSFRLRGQDGSFIPEPKR